MDLYVWCPCVFVKSAAKCTRGHKTELWPTVGWSIGEMRKYIQASYGKPLTFFKNFLEALKLLSIAFLGAYICKKKIARRRTPDPSFAVWGALLLQRHAPYCSALHRFQLYGRTQKYPVNWKSLNIQFSCKNLASMYLTLITRSILNLSASYNDLILSLKKEIFIYIYVKKSPFKKLFFLSNTLGALYILFSKTNNVYRPHYSSLVWTDTGQAIYHIYIWCETTTFINHYGSCRLQRRKQMKRYIIVWENGIFSWLIYPNHTKHLLMWTNLRTWRNINQVHLLTSFHFLINCTFNVDMTLTLLESVKPLSCICFNEFPQPSICLVTHTISAFNYASARAPQWELACGMKALWPHAKIIVTS